MDDFGGLVKKYGIKIISKFSPITSSKTTRTSHNYNHKCVNLDSSFIGTNDTRNPNSEAPFLHNEIHDIFKFNSRKMS